ncbi:MAG: PQQ-binding-like beta-propeller repeat protein [Planctomycetaceae bacterium]
MMSGRGYGESPLVDGERLICSPGGPDAALVALNKGTGDGPAVRVPELGPAGREGMGFSSIVVTEIAGVRQYVQLTGRGLVGVDARNGRWLWGYNGISNDTANIPTPVVRNDLVFAANGYNAGSVLLRIAPEAGQDPHSANWHAEPVYVLKGGQFQNHHGGVALVGDLIYGGHGSNNGLPTCLEFATGRIRWKQRGPGVGSAAVVVADGCLYFRYQNGLVALLAPGEETFELRGTMQIPGAGGDSWSHPVVANGRMYLREQDTLWVYDVRRDAGAEPRPAAGTPALSAELAALQELGASIEPLTGETPPLYRYAETVQMAQIRRRSMSSGCMPASSILTERSPQTAVAASGHSAGDPRFSRDTPLRGRMRATADDSARRRAQPNSVGNLRRRLDELSSISGLRVLILAGTNVSAAGLEHLKPLKQLVALDLEVCDAITDAACAQLQDWAQLRALVLKKSGFERERVTDRGLEHLVRLGRLEQLNLYGNQITDAGLVHLQGLTALRKLDLSLLPITDIGIAHLQTLQELQSLELLYSAGFAGPTLTDAMTDSLMSLSRLTSLNLTGARLTDTGLVRLQHLRELKSLQVVGTQVTDSGVRALKKALPECNVVVALSDEIPGP